METHSKIPIISLFAGAGGLDLGFEQAGFCTIWANEYDKTIWDTYEKNFPNVKLDRRNITIVTPSEIPDCDGIIGGPPCQSWSEGGAQRGIDDERGKLFLDYIRILKEKTPKFFLAENVSGMLQPKHEKAFRKFLEEFENAGYTVSWKLIDAHDYGVPQNRKRVIIVGYRNDLGKKFVFPLQSKEKAFLKHVLWDMPGAVAAKDKNKANDKLKIPNHEYMTGGFSTIYMARNRVRGWDEPSFTIQAGGRHAPIHPNAPKMVFVSQDVRVFKPGHEHEYRRLTVRECARIQTFPDEYIFLYKDVTDGYKMVGNAVPVKLANILANKIKEDLY